MPIRGQSSIHLGRVAGIDLYLHWSWFVVALIEIGSRAGRYSTWIWNVFEYLALFGIVLLHEFGHALACRKVGGTANRIMLWPLGGVAFVDPPPRPGATLWSIAAGPLVNVALLPIFGGFYYASSVLGWSQTFPDLYRLAWAVLWIDIGLFVFNILPIYPLDGGQILRSFLWYILGPARSLAVATALGILGGAAFLALALWTRSTWSILIAGYMLLNCWGGLQRARAMLRAEKRPRRDGFACPNCGEKPPLGPYWKCAKCSQTFDTFAAGAVCPSCGAQFPNTMCGACHQFHPMSAWSAGAYAQQTAQGKGNRI
jgi:Zn-dependent protease